MLGNKDQTAFRGLGLQRSQMLFASPAARLLRLLTLHPVRSFTSCLCPLYFVSEAILRTFSVHRTMISPWHKSKRQSAAPSLAYLSPLISTYQGLRLRRCPIARPHGKLRSISGSTCVLVTGTENAPITERVGQTACNCTCTDGR